MFLVGADRRTAITVCAFGACAKDGCQKTAGRVVLRFRLTEPVRETDGSVRQVIERPLSVEWWAPGAGRYVTAQEARHEPVDPDDLRPVVRWSTDEWQFLDHAATVVEGWCRPHGDRYLTAEEFGPDVEHVSHHVDDYYSLKGDDAARSRIRTLRMHDPPSIDW
jgi:hypothetical protein